MRNSNGNNRLLIDAPIIDSQSVDKMILVNTTAINFLEFNASIYDDLDALSDAEIDPYDHLQNIEHQCLIHHVINSVQ